MYAPPEDRTCLVCGKLCSSISAAFRCAKTHSDAETGKYLQAAVSAVFRLPRSDDEMVRIVGQSRLRSGDFRARLFKRGVIYLRHKYSIQPFGQYCWDIDGRYEQYREKILVAAETLDHEFTVREMANRIGSKHPEVVRRYLMTMSREIGYLVFRPLWCEEPFAGPGLIKAHTQTPIGRAELKKALGRVDVGHLIAIYLRRGILKKKWGQIVWAKKTQGWSDYPPQEAKTYLTSP